MSSEGWADPKHETERDTDRLQKAQPDCENKQQKANEDQRETKEVEQESLPTGQTENVTSRPTTRDKQEQEEVEGPSPGRPWATQKANGEQVIRADGAAPERTVSICMDNEYLTEQRREELREQRGDMLVQYPDKCREPRGPGPFYFLGGRNGASIITSYCESKGWQRTYDQTRVDYKLKWCEIKSSATYYNFKEGEQLVFQIPNNKVLTTKIGLLCSLREYDRVCDKVKLGYGLKKMKMEEFFPATFRMDVRDERNSFFAQYEGVCDNKNNVWICKPTGLNQGRGIFLLQTPEDITALKERLHNTTGSQTSKTSPFRVPQARIVQQYIQNPLLLKGRKFDVRSYFLIACTSPFMVFFRHGYVRLTCDLYNPNSSDLSAHLTNQYMQKKNPLYSELKEETVWSMARFNAYVNEKFMEPKNLPRDWVLGAFARRMQQVMMQCFLAVKAKLDRKLGYFDLIGCDFLIDEDFKVWLLEMNSNPALHTNCEVLREVVPSTVTETLDLTLEIFHKRLSGTSLLPLSSQKDFILLFGPEMTPHPHQALSLQFPLTARPTQQTISYLTGTKATCQKALHAKTSKTSHVFPRPSKPTSNRVELRLSKCTWQCSQDTLDLLVPRIALQVKSTVLSHSTPALSEGACFKVRPCHSDRDDSSCNNLKHTMVPPSRRFVWLDKQVVCAETGKAMQEGDTSKL
ncbi:protein polyglycylase TTLL10 [Chanos chanos]|uniref:Protein polyglycylase TTLL10 n=1 Tax=Chanos chanos TaxID=29144 RepID=A0A6J2UV41_CHACN|nr:inactive polyglycylase TTLL10 [Chanos chanos]